MKTKIPLEDQEKAIKIISDFNKATFGMKSGIEYYADFKGDFLYLNRKEGKTDGPICRLKYTGKFTDWNFAIFKWSSERYDPNEFLFPGSEHINGTIEGALKASQKAYPPNRSPSGSDILSIFEKIFSKKNKS
jgi:hypothetical protein